MPKDLALNQSPSAAVFREIEAILKADKELSRIFRKDAWRSWTGEAGDDEPLSSDQQASIVLTPSVGDDEWWSPESVGETLTIEASMYIRTRRIDDALNLWYAFKRALYPVDDPALDPPGKPRFDMIARLQNAGAGIGAQTGLILFSGPSIAPNVAGRDEDESLVGFTVTASMRVKVHNALNV